MGEGRVTTLTYTLLISITVMILFSSLVVNMASKTEIDTLPEYDTFINRVGFGDDGEYKESYTNITEHGKNIIISQDADNSTKKWYEAWKDKFDMAWSESILGRAYNTLSQTLKMMGLAAKGLNIALSSVTGIPTQIITLVTVLLSMSIVFVFVKAIWEKKI